MRSIRLKAKLRTFNFVSAGLHWFGGMLKFIRHEHAG
jgi:hypothetical protein